MKSACSKFFFLVSALNAVGGIVLSSGSSSEASEIDSEPAPSPVTDAPVAVCSRENAGVTRSTALQRCEHRDAP